jgi:hypothetical protein
MTSHALMILAAIGFIVAALIDLHQDRQRQLAELDTYLERFTRSKG